MGSPKLFVIFLMQFLFKFGNFQKTKPNPPADPPAPPRFVSLASLNTNGNFIRKAMDLIIEKGLYQQRLVYKSPQELKKLFDFSLTENETPDNQLLEIIEKLFEISSRPAHRFRLTRRVAGLDPFSLVGDWMSVTMHSFMPLYIGHPIFTLMEIKISEYLSKQIGWDAAGDGMPTSGAGAANSMAMYVALFYFDRTTRDIGISHVRNIRIYVSKHASISWKTAAIYNGIGTNAITEIDVNKWGRMNASDLERTVKNDIRRGRKPLMVVATAGTPVFGVIDPLKTIAKICKDNHIWMHVDAELAGGYLFTPSKSKFQRKLAGIDGADSVSISMWLFAAPYPSSMILTKNPNALQETFGLHASYVFDGNQDIYNRSYDRGDRTIQTTRRPEIAKIWFAAARGEEQNAELFDFMDENLKSFIQFLSERKGFVLVKIPSNPATRRVPLVSFYYVPKIHRNKALSPAIVAKLTETTQKINREIQRRGLAHLSVSYIPHESSTYPAFFTISFTNTRFTKYDFDFILELIATIGENALPRNEKVEIPKEDSYKGSKTLSFPNFPLGKYQNFFGEIFSIAFDKGLFFSRKGKVCDFKPPEYFLSTNTFDLSFPYPNDENLLEKMKTLFKTLIKYTPHLGHPYFTYILTAGLDPFSMVADYISPVLNTPMITYDDGSAPFLLMEQELVKQMLLRVYGTERGDGIITDGGSMGNQIAIALARYNINNGIGFMTRGGRRVAPKKYVIFMSQDAHYSTKKGAILEGIGQNYTIEVQANNIGQMRAGKLREAILKTIAKGDIPIMVVITTGTSVYGAIDPVNDIVEICSLFKLWCHVDGMFGGLTIFSDKYMSLNRGIERADSWGADLHKLMGSTNVCTILITRHEDMFRKVFSMSREEELQEEPDEDRFKLNQLGRHAQLDKGNNVLKFWLLWKAKGRKGLELHINRIMSNKNYIIKEIRRRQKNNEGFELIIDDFELTNICFRYIPRALNPAFNANLDQNSKEWKMAMDKFTFSVEKEFVRNGIIFFSTQYRRMADETNTPLFIKFVMMGSALRQNDIRFLLDAIAYYGSQIQERRTVLEDFEMEQIMKHFDPLGPLPEYYAP